MVKGYAYQLTGDHSDWRSCADDRWTVVMCSAYHSKFLGFRAIDGVRCTVWQTKRDIFAQTAVAAPPPKGLR